MFAHYTTFRVGLGKAAWNVAAMSGRLSAVRRTGARGRFFVLGGSESRPFDDVAKVVGFADERCRGLSGAGGPPLEVHDLRPEGSAARGVAGRQLRELTLQRRDGLSAQREAFGMVSRLVAVVPSGVASPHRPMRMRAWTEK